MEYKTFKSLLEIRDFCVRAVLDHKDLACPKVDFFVNALKSFLKGKGYTKISSRNSLAYLKDRVIFTYKNGTYVAFAVDVRVRKRPVILAVNFSRVTIEDNVYYLGSIKDKASVMILTPHFFTRYQERTKCASLDEAITNFMGYLLAESYDEFPIAESPSGEILVRFKEGVGLGHKTTLGLQKKEVVFYKTFVSNEMLTDEQKAIITKGVENADNIP